MRYYLDTAVTVHKDGTTHHIARHEVVPDELIPHIGNPDIWRKQVDDNDEPGGVRYEPVEAPKAAGTGIVPDTSALVAVQGPQAAQTAPTPAYEPDEVELTVVDVVEALDGLDIDERAQVRDRLDELDAEDAEHEASGQADDEQADAGDEDDEGGEGEASTGDELDPARFDGLSLDGLKAEADRREVPYGTSIGEDTLRERLLEHDAEHGAPADEDDADDAGDDEA